MDFGSNRNRALLVFLALRLGRLTTRDQLVTALWPNADLDAGRNRLSTALVAIRKMLAHGGQSAIIADRTHVSLDANLCKTDAEEFLLLQNRAGHETGTTAIETIQEALHLYGSTLANEVYDEWVIPDQSRFSQAFDLLACRLAQLLSEAKRTEELAALVQTYEHLGDDQEILFEIRQCLPGTARKFNTEASRYGMPPPADLFMGRDEDLAQMHRAIEALAPGHILAVTGIGGVGKSSLVRAYWAQCGGSPEGALFLPLNQVETLESLVYLIADALGVPPGQKNLEEVILGHGNTQYEFLVLDAFEHLDRACDRWVQRFAESAPNMHVIVTSRRPLFISDQTILPVRSLSLETGTKAKHSPAAACLLAILRRVQPEFEPTDEVRAYLERISTQVAGLPLALQHMAKRARYLSLADLARGLEEKGGAHRASVFTRVVVETYDSLSSTTQELWNALSCFSAAIPTEAIKLLSKRFGEKALNDLADIGIFKRAVVGLNDEVELFDMYREEIFGMMEKPAKIAARAHWSGFWISWLQEMKLSLPQEVLGGLVDRYHRDVIGVARFLPPDEAVLYVDGLYYLWLARGRGVEPLRMLQLLTKRRDKMQPRSKARLDFLRGVFEGFTGDPGSSRTSLAQTREMLPLCDPDLAARVLHQAVWSAESPSWEQLTEVEQKATQPASQIEAILALASHSTINGNIELALAEFERALHLAEASGNTYFICGILREIGWLNIRLGWLRRAEETLSQHRRLLANSLGDRAASGPLGYVRGLLGRHVEGLEELDRTEALERSANYTLSVAHALMWKSLLNHDLGRLAQSRQNLAEALKLVGPWEDENVEVTLHATLAECALEQGETDQAELAIRQGRAIERKRKPLERAQSLLDLAEGRLAATFGNWGAVRERVGAVLGRSIPRLERPAIIGALEQLALSPIEGSLSAEALRLSFALRNHIGMPLPPIRQARYADLADRLGVPMRPVGVQQSAVEAITRAFPYALAGYDFGKAFGAILAG